MTPEGEAGPGEPATAGNHVDRTGFAYVRAPYKGDFAASVVWPLMVGMCATDKFGTIEGRSIDRCHGGYNRAPV